MSIILSVCFVPGTVVIIRRTSHLERSSVLPERRQHQHVEGNSMLGEWRGVTWWEPLVKSWGQWDLTSVSERGEAIYETVVFLQETVPFRFYQPQCLIQLLACSGIWRPAPPPPNTPGWNKPWKPHLQIWNSIWRHSTPPPLLRQQQVLKCWALDLRLALQGLWRGWEGGRGPGAWFCI